ncbi:sensor histidine kinase [Arthrobacter sp. GMC3]|uniref:sensor histidine kinase n=1 Tax=Arthrobacter sp. GMC3 TaxID=2058894 RepID=UPI000CE3DC4B|nr:sensor histidine kinase [Arthrobacter sp. GMC3]
MRTVRRGPPLGVLAVTVALIQVFGTHVAAVRQPGAHQLDALAYALLLAGPALLLLRRRAPELMLTGVLAVTGAYFLLGYPWGPAPLSLALAIILATAARRRIFSWSVTATVVVAVVAWAVLLGGDLALLRAVAVSAWLVILVLIGEGLRARLDRQQQRRAREREAKARAEDEYRLTLARDIHDVVAHSLSMINVRASVALHLADRDPDQLKPALEAIKSASKDSLDQVRELLGVLRRDAPLQPALTLSRLPQLVEDARGAGLSASLAYDVDPEALRESLGPAGEAVIYRMVQEAVTNVLRHAGATRVWLRVGVVPTAALPGAGQLLEVTVEDDGHGLQGAAEGNGLRGMRERVTAVGGNVTLTGLHPGTRVSVQIPLGVETQGTGPNNREQP